MNLINALQERHSKSQVCFYVDDMLIIKRDISDINATKHMGYFDMKEIEVPDVIGKVLDKFK